MPEMKYIQGIRTNSGVIIITGKVGTVRCVKPLLDVALGNFTERAPHIGLCIFKKNILPDIMFHPCLGVYLFPAHYLDLLGTRIRTAAKFYLDL